MLSLTRKADYALVAAVYLARRQAEGGGPVSAREIAEQFDLPRPLLMNVLKQLAGAGLLRSVRGANGGYGLVVPADRLTVLQLVEAVAEGDEHDDDADASSVTEASGNGAEASEGEASGGDISGGDASGAGVAALRRLQDQLDGFLRGLTVAALLRDTGSSVPGSLVFLGAGGGHGQKPSLLDGGHRA